jgi:hypothetical protein
MEKMQFDIGRGGANRIYNVLRHMDHAPNNFDPRLIFYIILLPFALLKRRFAVAVIE